MNREWPPLPVRETFNHMHVIIHGSNSFGYPVSTKLAVADALKLEKLLNTIRYALHFMAAFTHIIVTLRRPLPSSFDELTALLPSFDYLRYLCTLYTRGIPYIYCMPLVYKVHK
jgi:hypothetical protein